MRPWQYRPLHAVALATLLAFGCATVNPAPPPPPRPLPRVFLADPEIELWIEGDEKVDPADSAQAFRESRAALNQALAGRGLDAVEADAVLVVQERAVARTSGRKVGQVLAAVGIVVVIVAVVVALVVSSKSSSSEGKTKASAHAPRRAGGPAAARPAPAPARIAGAPHAPRAPASRVGAPAPVPGGLIRPTPSRGQVWRPGHGVVRAPARIGPEPDFFFGPDFWFGATIEVPVEEPPPPPPPPEEQPGSVEAPEEAPADDYIMDRGFFSGDRVELTLEVRDSRTGAVLWQHVYRDSIDPRDPGEVRRALDQALAGQPWASETASSAAGAPTPEGAKTH